MVVYVSVWQVHTYPFGFSHTLLTLICRIDIWHPSLRSSRRGVGGGGFEVTVPVEESHVTRTSANSEGSLATKLSEIARI